MQQQCVARECSIDYYNSSVSRVTATFQAISKEVIQITHTFEDKGLQEATKILKEVQVREKEKLELTVQWQLVLEKHRTLAPAECKEASDAECLDEEKAQLKRRYDKEKWLFSNRIQWTGLGKGV